MSEGVNGARASPSLRRHSPNPLRRVAVVGAGSAGLSAAKELREVFHEHLEEGKFEIVVFERRPKVGGIWQYDDDPGVCRFYFDKDGRAHARWFEWPSKVEGVGVADRGRVLERENRPPGPMYDGLRTNITSDLMSFRDTPFPEDQPLFPSRAMVNDYIAAFSRQNSLEGLIRFSTDIVSIRRVDEGSHNENDPSQSHRSWTVTSQDLGTQQVTIESFDQIMVASGRCNLPSIPSISGLWHFKGELLHSAWYRSPLPFRGKTVLVVGNSSSGMDIARELSGYVIRDIPGKEEWTQDSEAEPNRTGVKVYNSVEDADAGPPMDFNPRDSSSPAWARRINVVPRVIRVEPCAEAKSGSRLVFEDGSELDDVDTIIFGTGFSYEFPFLPQDSQPFLSQPILPPPLKGAALPDETFASYIATRQHGEYFQPTAPSAPMMSNLDDWQLFHRLDTSIAFLGVPFRIVPFPFAQVQARYAALLWAGLVPRLPRLDSSKRPNDPDRWTTLAELDSYKETEENGVNTTPFIHLASHDIGTPSDMNYIDAIISHFSDKRAVKADWESEYAATSDGLGGGTPRGPEKWYLVPQWRRERRLNGKKLRRQNLGY